MERDPKASDEPSIDPRAETVPSDGPAPPPRDAPELDLFRLSEYVPLRELGRGSTGIVFLADHVPLGRRVALKILWPQYSVSPEARDRFAREAKALAAIDSPHVVPVYDVGEERGLSFYAMKFIEGRTLHGVLADGPLDLDRARDLLIQGAIGLADIHGAGILHRDVKPSNLMTNEEGRLMISDFGLARSAASSTLTTEGTILGTPTYMAPEQARGEVSSLCPASDLYSLGASFFHLLSGCPPFEGGSIHEILHRKLEGAVPALGPLRPDLPDWLCAVVARLVARRIEDRYQDARSLADDLAARTCSTGPTASRRPDEPADVGGDLDDRIDRLLEGTAGAGGVDAVRGLLEALLAGASPEAQRRIERVLRQRAEALLASGEDVALPAMLAEVAGAETLARRAADKRRALALLDAVGADRSADAVPPDQVQGETDPERRLRLLERVPTSSYLEEVERAAEAEAIFPGISRARLLAVEALHDLRTCLEVQYTDGTVDGFDRLTADVVAAHERAGQIFGDALGPAGLISLLSGLLERPRPGDADDDLVARLGCLATLRSLGARPLGPGHPLVDDLGRLARGAARARQPTGRDWVLLSLVARICDEGRIEIPGTNRLLDEFFRGLGYSRTRAMLLASGTMKGGSPQQKRYHADLDRLRAELAALAEEPPTGSWGDLIAAAIDDFERLAGETYGDA